MKNKFLAMAVVSALVAVSVLPSAFADVTPIPVSADIEPGTYGVTAHGDFSAAIEMNGLTTPPLADTIVSATFVNDTDYFKAWDATATDGMRVQMKLSSSEAGKFVYTGDSVAQADLAVTEFKWCPKTDAGACTGTYTEGADTGYSISWISDETAADGEDADMYSLTLDGTTYATGTNSAFNYFTSIASVPMAVHLNMDKITLNLPAGSNAGTYASTWVVTAVDDDGV